MKLLRVLKQTLMISGVFILVWKEVADELYVWISNAEAKRLDKTIAVSWKSFKTEGPKKCLLKQMHMFYHVLFRRIHTKLAKVYYRLRRRHNQAPSNIFSTAVTISLFWAPKELSELPEMRFKVPFNMIGKLTTAFLNRPIPAHTQILVHGQVFDTTIQLEQRRPSVKLFRPFDAHILIYTS